MDYKLQVGVQSHLEVCYSSFLMFYPPPFLSPYPAFRAANLIF
ncbi:hypothetical protein Gogos_000971 [Gossypium gossypioides]|uniref:Uncharacterized protein n=1 Tax=Gossypium gossypioides TaxID=34282 RepID=A0A7J9CUH7_GOSGO|nr:hypothetical protein [Gossypium gossypioides]